MNELQKIESFRLSLAIAETIEEIKLIGDAAAAYADLMRRQNVSYEQQNELGKFRIEISQKEGEWLNTYYPHGGINNHNQRKVTNGNLPTMPVNKKQSSNSRLLKTATNEELKEVQEIIIQRKEVIEPKKIAAEIRTKRRRKQATQNKIPQSLPKGVYNIICCDPPWQYDFAETDNRKIENHYPTMTVKELCEMPLPKFAADSLLLMWATAPKLCEAIKVIEAWGFIYRTHCVWDKEKIGMGYWFRSQHELLLVATKGKFSPPEVEYRYSSIYREQRTDHSRKPDFYYEWIEQAFKGNKIELFARTKREGWEVWGNEVELLKHN